MQVLTPKSRDCGGSPPRCSVGGVPVGEYLFDFRAANVSVRNQTMAAWFVEEYMLGQSGAGSDSIVGYYIDDGWAADVKSNAHGPSFALSTLEYPFVWVNGVLNGYSSTRVSLWDSLMFGRLAMRFANVRAGTRVLMLVLVQATSVRQTGAAAQSKQAPRKTPLSAAVEGACPSTSI